MTKPIVKSKKPPTDPELDKITAELIADGQYAAFGDPWMNLGRAVGDQNPESGDRDNPSAPWFRAIVYIYEFKDDRPFRELIKAGVKPPEEMHKHIDELFERRLFPTSSKRGPKGTPSLWKRSAKETLLAIDLENAKEAAKAKGKSTTEYLNRQLNKAETDAQHKHIDKLVNLLGGRRGSARKKNSP